MGEPQRSDAPESDRRQAPRFAAELLGKASVRLLGGSEVTLINFSERGILFQSETRLLVGARGTVRIVVGNETVIAAGTVVRSLVQGMASGKLAFHTALALDQPLALATAVEARERAKAAAARPAPATPAPVEPEPEPAAAAPVPPAPPIPSGKTIEKRSHKGGDKAADKSDRKAERRAPVAEVAPPPPPAPPPEPESGPEPAPVAAITEAPPAVVVTMPAAPLPAIDGATGSGFDGGFESGSFGWSDAPAEPAVAALSVLFVSTTKERIARVQGVLAGQRHDIALTTLVHSKADALGDVARQHDVLLFDFAIGPDALERTLSALRTSPLGASIAILVPQQTALPASVSSLANACVIETTSPELFAAALRDAAWTPWQPVDAPAPASAHDVIWKAFDALPVAVVAVDADGTIVHANAASARLADGADLAGRTLASFFAPGYHDAVTGLVRDGLAQKQDGTLIEAPPLEGDGVRVVLEALSVIPGAAGQPTLAVRCELRSERAAEPPPPPVPDLSAEVAALTDSHDALTRALERATHDAAMMREELDEGLVQLSAARRERDELRGQLEIVQRDLERARELQAAGAAKIAELEKAASDHVQVHDGLARLQGQHATALDDLRAARAELDALKGRIASESAESDRSAARSVAIEAGARQAIEELKTARADVQRLTRERDQALAAVEAEKTRAAQAVAAARDDAAKGRKKIGAADDATALTVTKLQRLVDELRGELKQEQESRKELEELLDQNAANLEQTIQDYEERLEALGAGVEDKRPKKTRQR
jgi:hypothetical protein